MEERLFSLDRLLRDLAAHADNAAARSTAKNIECPSAHLQLIGRPRHTHMPALTPTAVQPNVHPPMRIGIRNPPLAAPLLLTTTSKLSF